MQFVEKVHILGLFEHRQKARRNKARSLCECEERMTSCRTKKGRRESSLCLLPIWRGLI